MALSVRSSDLEGERTKKCQYAGARCRQPLGYAWDREDKEVFHPRDRLRDLGWQVESGVFVRGRLSNVSTLRSLLMDGVSTPFEKCRPKRSGSGPGAGSLCCD
jgi:hypothetical protein